MTRFLSEEWLTELEEIGSKLPKGNLSLVIQYEISGTEQGKLRFSLVIKDSQIKEILTGKNKNADCGVSTTSTEAFKILSGKKKVIEAFMQGDLKVEGDYQRYLIDFESVRKSEQWKEMCTSLEKSAGLIEG